MSPQGLSKVITRMESELERDLFVRTHNGVEPTRYADVLQEQALKISESLQNIKSEVQNVGSERVYELNIATTIGIFSYMPMDFFMDFRKRHPSIDPVIIEVSDYFVKTMLDDDSSEIGFILGPFDTVKYNGIVYTYHIPCVVINKNNPLSRKTEITYEDLAHEPLVLKGRRFSTYNIIMNEFLRAGVKPHVALETTEIELIHQIVASGNGVGISEDYQACLHPFPNTVILPLADKSARYDICLIWKKGKVRSREAKIFEQYALTWMEANKKRLFHWNRDKIEHSL